MLIGCKDLNDIIVVKINHCNIYILTYMSYLGQLDCGSSATTFSPALLKMSMNKFLERVTL